MPISGEAGRPACTTLILVWGLRGGPRNPSSNSLVHGRATFAQLMKRRVHPLIARRHHPSINDGGDSRDDKGDGLSWKERTKDAPKHP